MLFSVSRQPAFTRLAIAAGASLSLFASGQALASAAPGSAAPAFTLTDIAGKPVSLADLKGKWVALEWTNPECPFVKKHYDSGNMQSTQRDAAANKVVWVQVNSTASKHQDYKSAQQMKDWLASMKASPAHVALDDSGAVGKAYGAKTTPHMYLISPEGTVVYNGAIDDKRSTNPADVANAKNYLKVAMSEALAGKPVSTPASTPYGCSVKY
ncbi:redoxin domain-containing protein [Chitinimonas sp. BJYL2]|uniref:redoxin domain-containing protein n=1 Tax=Chitinimonas sp. BJYL2 TaxID=2976696 RepID=UPI0022B339B1|nr:redoxin domain-containing protein [Chitinimonas sp. BJYL2]